MHSSGEAKPQRTANRSIAHKLADKQQEISVTEFFEKNKHILGFDSRSKSLLMGIKEAVDNALDACEEASILPDLKVKVNKTDDEEYTVMVEDNGPGIVHKMIPNVFGRLLFGSRFHSLRQSRGQQGIGISATVMYGNISTGKPAHIMSKVEDEDTAWMMDIIIDTKKNRPVVSNDEPFIWADKSSGTRIEYSIKGRYITGRQSIYEYLRNTAIVNPHTRISFEDPEGKIHIFERATEVMPPKAKEIKPHIEGLELGDLQKMANTSAQKTMRAFLKTDFTRISDRVALGILEKAGVNESFKPANLDRLQCRDIMKSVEEVKIMAPPTDCLSPIGDTLIKKGLKHVLEGMRPDYYSPPVTRPPKTVNGNPFIVEAGIVYGGDIPVDGQASILRFANRVPLLYQQGACVITKAIESMDWRRYGLEQRGGKGIPYGPAIILVHVASTKVPFTSEGKEAVANLGEIQNEIVLALRLCARNLKGHLNKKEKKKKTMAKFSIVQEILPEMAEKAAQMLNRDVPELDRTISRIMNVVWVEPSSKTDKSGLRTVSYRIYNYTGSEKNFQLHARVPRNCLNETILSDYLLDVNEDGKVTWAIQDLPPSAKLTLEFQLDGDMSDVLDENDVYVSGLNPAMVMGADPLPGDWGIKDMDVTELDSDENDYVDEDDDEEEEEVLDDEQ
ncbi:MAG: DNA topoisomerase VI subunit B [Candidatus Methanomethylophilaceae archaeon]